MNRNILSTLGLAALFAQPALAYDFNVPVDTPREISKLYAVNEDCTSAGDAVVRLTTQPAHGTITMRKGKDYPNYRAPNPRVSCNRRLVASTQVWYNPQRGYAGPDSVSLDVLYPNGSSQQFTVSISVR